MNVDIAILQKEFETTLSSFEKASPAVIRSAISILQKEPSEHATLAGCKIDIQPQDSRIQTLFTQIQNLASHPEIETWVLTQGYDSLSAMASQSLEHALWNHVEAKTSLDPTYDPLIHFLKGSESSPLPSNPEEAYLQLVQKIDQRLEELTISPPKEGTEAEADRQNWPMQLQIMKESWNTFKKRVQTFPKAGLFSDNDAIRKEEYLKFGLQFGFAFTGLEKQGQEHLALLHIPEFLETCKTGWDAQIRQLMSLGKTYTPSDSALLSAWEASREVRRSLLDKALQKAFPSHADGVHYQTAAKHAGNELFSLGYSSQDLGSFEENMVLFVKSLLTEAMLKLLQEEGPQELIRALIQRYASLPSKESLFDYYLGAYEEEIKTNQDLVIDPCTKLVNVFAKLESLGKAPSPTKEFWEGLQECFHLCQEAGIPSPSFSTRPQFERLVEDKLKKTVVFQKYLTKITKEDLLELIKEPKETLSRLLSNASKEEVERVLSSLQEPLNALQQSLTKEAQEKDFETVKTRALTYAKAFPSVRAEINCSRLEHLLTDQNKLTPFGAYVWGLSSHVLKLQECKEAQNTKILQWIQEKELPTQEQETLIQLLQSTVDQLSAGSRKEKIQEALKTKDLNLIQQAIHANTKCFTLKEMVALGDVDGIKEWLQTHTLSGY